MGVLAPGLYTLDPIDPPKKSTHRRIEGAPPFFFTPNLIFLWLKTPCKVSEPYNNPFWVKSNREEREKNIVNSGHLVLWQHTQAARTKNAMILATARTLLWPIILASVQPQFVEPLANNSISNSLVHSLIAKAIAVQFYSIQIHYISQPNPIKAKPNLCSVLSLSDSQDE